VETPARIAAAAVVITMVADDAALEAVRDGANGLLAGLPAGGVRVSMSAW
jgi:3-hydroxyisobutyrate dehydrogenase-like beta-hydroxyacid dehydrogenase